MYHGRFIHRTWFTFWPCYEPSAAALGIVPTMIKLFEFDLDLDPWESCWGG